MKANERMIMEQNRIKERLLKMYRLATDGVDGEKETAQKILEANLAKYGLTMDDLVESDGEKKTYWFTAKDKYQRMLLGQIYCVFVCKTKQYSTYTRTDRKYDVGLEMTEVEAAELNMIYDFYLNLWKKELEKQKEILLLAFINKHDIALQAANIEEMTDEEIRMAKRACQMMDDLEYVSFKKQIGRGQLELNM